jgi:Ca-activated chloride channel family protein
MAPRSQTFAELRVVRKAVAITEAGATKRLPYPRERLGDGTLVEVEAQGLCWLRADGGAKLLVMGPASLRYHPDAIDVEQGRIFVDSPGGTKSTLQTPKGPLVLSSVRASIEVAADKSVRAYVLSGEIRAKGESIARPGEELLIADGDPKRQTVLSWDDWTGGLATSDRAISPAPFGVGTIGARIPGQSGRPRWPLAVQRLDVHVNIVDDLAITEVDQTF